MQDTFYLEEVPRDKTTVWGKKSVYTLEFDSNSGRGLCGRGNYSQELATHKKRLFRAKKNNKYYSITKVAKDLSDALKELQGDRVAILLDGSLTLAEIAKALALAKKLGTKFVASLPAEDIATAPFKNNFAFENIAEAAVNIIIGDVFTLSPTITKLIHDAKAKGRGLEGLWPGNSWTTSEPSRTCLMFFEPITASFRCQAPLP